MQTTRRWFTCGLPLIAVACLLVACGGNGDVSSTMPTDPASPAAMMSDDETQAMNCIPEADDRGFIDADAFKDGMTCVVPLFPWPEGKQPSRAMMEEYVESLRGWETASYESSMEFTQIAGYNACAWSEEWQEARQAGDAQREATALEYLLTMVPDPAASIAGFPSGGYDESTTDAFRLMAEQAELGDPAPLQAFSTGCSWISWETS